MRRADPGASPGAALWMPLSGLRAETLSAVDRWFGARPRVQTLTNPRAGRPALVATALYALAGAALLAGALSADLRLAGARDWVAFRGQAAAEVRTLVHYHQFPLWNPWRHGGEVSFAQPESMFLSPVTPLALLVGVPAAFRILLLPLFVAGCLGMWCLAKDLGLAGGARWVPGIVFFASSAFVLYLAGGLPNWLFGMAILPWLVLCARRSSRDMRALVLGGLLYAGLLFCGSIHHFVFFPGFLVLYGIGLSFEGRSPRPLVGVLLLLGLGVVLAAVRLVPLGELYLAYPRELEATSRYIPPDMLWRVFLGTNIPEITTAGSAFVKAGDSWMYWVSAGFFVGPVAVLLALVGAFSRRGAVGLALVGLVHLWLTFGTGVQPSLWDALRDLPLLHSMQAPERLVLLVGFALALCAGFGFDYVAAHLSRVLVNTAARRTCLAGLLTALVGPLLWVNAPLSRAAFVLPPVAQPAGGAEFRQSRVQARPEQWGGELFDGVWMNRGNVEGSSDIPSLRAVTAEGDRGYRGEAFLRRQARDVEVQVTPNVITLRATSAFPDLLVVNQNYFPGWRAQGTVNGPARSEGGRLAVAVPAGTHDITLRFGAGPVWRGLAFSLAGLALAAVLWRAASGVATPRRLGALAGLLSLAIAGVSATVLTYAGERSLPHKLFHRGGAFRGPVPAPPVLEGRAD